MKSEDVSRVVKILNYFLVFLSIDWPKGDSLASSSEDFSFGDFTGAFFRELCKYFIALL